MSDQPTPLYRKCAHHGDLRMQSIHDCDGYMPVELCEHDKFDPHRVEKVGDWTDPYITIRDCPGAGIGGDE